MSFIKVQRDADGRYIKQGQTKAAEYNNLGPGWPLLINLFRIFPDFLDDLLWEEKADYRLGMMQRIFLRVLARYQYVDITACRGATKSFCVDLQEYNEMVVWIGQKSAIFGPSYKQSAQIASQIFKQIKMCAPILTDMLMVTADSKDRFEVETEYGSSMSIEAYRGNTVFKVTAEETAQEERPPFDADYYKEAVIPQVRAEYRINGRPSRGYVRFKQHSITSAGRRQQYAYEIRHTHRRLMARGESSFIIDVPFGVILLEQMRPVAWAENIRHEHTASEFMREMESIYSGSDKSPLIRDEMISEARVLPMMEEHHCCKDRENKIKAEDVIYILGYDVSYRDNKGNAKCACVVLKCTKQTDFYHRDKYLKQVVWIEDWTPADTPTPIAQAQKLRRIFDRYTFEGSQTYIAIDAWQYGTGVLTSLFEEPPGGARPLCCYKHSQYTELEREGAIPVIYPIRAGGQGTTDPDSDMILNAQMQFEHRNVQLLTGNMAEGVEAYKAYHRIKDDSLNHKIAAPYKRTNELIIQLQNLREEPSGQGIREKRITNRIQRDSWSALKYALRFAQVLEKANLQVHKQKSDWDGLLSAYKDDALLPVYSSSVGGRTVTSRQGGRRF